jgi:hypothetical protein
MQIKVGYNIVIFLLLSHESETWSFILKGEHRLRVNQKMVPSKILVLKMEKDR